MQVFPDWQVGKTRLFSKLDAARSAVHRRCRNRVKITALLALGLPIVVAAVSGQQIPFVAFIPNGVLFPNANGASQTYSTIGGGIDETGPFFQSLGTNGRSCSSCHQPSDGMSVSAANVQLRFLLTQGADPIFRTVDGSNCDHSIDVSTLEGREAAYSLLRTRGLIRIAIGVPASADYYIKNVGNPYGCNETNVISMYRRPLPATNLRFLSAVMFDGRESTSLTGTQKITYVVYIGVGTNKRAGIAITPGLNSFTTDFTLEPTNGCASVRLPVKFTLNFNRDGTLNTAASSVTVGGMV